MRRSHVRRYEHFNGLPDEVITRVTEQRFASGVGQSNHALRVDDHQSVRREFEPTAEELPGFPQLPVSFLAPRDVIKAAAATENCAVLDDWCRRIFDGEAGTVFPP